MCGIYIHFPFCKGKCPYCAFYSENYTESKAEKYIKALKRNIKSYYNKGIIADTLYFGGGTPSLMTAVQISDIIELCKKVFVLENAEITIECNPSTVDKEKLYKYRQAGINRLSVGMQSSNNSTLKWLGRKHTVEEAAEVVKEASKAGYKNISCDLMIGVSGQDEKNINNEILYYSNLPIDHISVYMLEIHKNTPFDCEKIFNESANEEKMAEIYEEVVKSAKKCGFSQYEISNFSKKGMESKHNLKYWHGEEYLGFGSSAHSYFNGKRYYCPNDVNSFIESDSQKKIITDENPDKLEEYIMLGLRLCEGIKLSIIEKLTGDILKTDIIRRKALKYSKLGLCVFDGENISFTTKGMLVSNALISDFIV